MRRYSRMLHPRHWWRTAGLTKRPRAAERRRLVAKPTAAVAEEDACSAVTSEPFSAVMLEPAAAAHNVFLSEDLLLLILQPTAVLNDARAVRHVLSVSRVCSAWHKATASELLWRHLCEHRWPSTRELPLGGGASYRSLYRRRAVPAGSAARPLLDSLHFLLELRQPGKSAPVVSRAFALSDAARGGRSGGIFEWEAPRLSLPPWCSLGACALWRSSDGKVYRCARPDTVAHGTCDCDASSRHRAVEPLHFGCRTSFAVRIPSWQVAALSAARSPAAAARMGLPLRGRRRRRRRLRGRRRHGRAVPWERRRGRGRR